MEHLLDDFFEFSFSDVGFWVGSVFFLVLLENDDSPVGLHEVVEFFYPIGEDFGFGGFIDEVEEEDTELPPF